MLAKTLIVHGWSDCSDSFAMMKERLIATNIGSEDDIFFVDYESREDDLTFDEIAMALNNRLKQRGLIGPSGENVTDLNVLVHSTGGLVIRHWLAKYYGNDLSTCPVKRLIMLAPANFGSPLAHRGKSLLGGLVKGRWKVGDMFEVGRGLLDGLELASPFQWDLAHRDLLTAKSLANCDHIYTTVLVGADDYKNIRGWINKPGTDGTVVIAGAGLNVTKLLVDYTNSHTGPGPKRPTLYEHSATRDCIAFGIIDGYDHGSIVTAFEQPGSVVEEFVVSALSVKTEHEFGRLRDQLKRQTAAAFYLNEIDEDDAAAQNHALIEEAGKDDWYLEIAPRRRYQQFIFRCVDDFNEPVKDYTLEFFVLDKRRWNIDRGFVRETLEESLSPPEAELSDVFNRIMFAEAHQHSQDQSFRRSLVEENAMDRLYEAIEMRFGDNYALGGSIHIPDVDERFVYDAKTLQNVIIFDPADTAENVSELFIENTTTLIELRIRRYSGYVFVDTRPRRH